MRLSKIQVGKEVIIEKLPKSDKLSRRLSAMGCREKMTAELVLKGRNLSEYRIGETLFGIKSIDLENITVIYSDRF